MLELLFIVFIFIIVVIEANPRRPSSTGGTPLWVSNPEEWRRVHAKEEARLKRLNSPEEIESASQMASRDKLMDAQLWDGRHHTY
jgi:hypothetical protein